MDSVRHTGPPWWFKAMLVIMALAGAIFLVYLGWWFAAALSATFWPT